MTSKKQWGRAGWLPAFCLLAFSSSAGFAQQTEPGASRMIEEVVVTATRREASIQEVPVAVSAFNGLELERGGVEDLRDLQNLTPSFNMNTSQTESQGATFRIRGVGTTGNNIGLESAVGVFLDGVTLSRPGIALGDLVDIESLEVLRGPQGTLFGRNTSAGALVIRTKKPDLARSEAFVNATGSNFDGTNLQAGGSIPLIRDKLAFRGSVAVRDRDGFLNSTTGAESLTRDRVSLRGQLLWQIDEVSDLRIIGDYADADEQCCDGVITAESSLVANGSFAAAGLPADGGAPASGPDALEDRKSNGEQFENPFEQWGISAEYNRTFDDFDVIYIGSYRDFEASSEQFSDFVNTDVFSVSPQAAQGQETFDAIETTTHELRFEGDTGRLEWMIGGFYMSEEIVEQQGVGLESDFSRNTSANLFGVAGPAAMQGVFGALSAFGVPLADGTPFGSIHDADPTNPALAFTGGIDPDGSFARNDFQQDAENWSVFTHNTLRVTDSLDLVAGLRWVSESKDGEFNQLEAQNPACLNALANAGPTGVAANAAAAGLPADVVGAAGGAASVAAGQTCFPFTIPTVDPNDPTDPNLPFVGALPQEFDQNFSDEELVWTVKGVYAFNDLTTGYASFTHGFKSGGFNLDATAATGGSDPTFDSETVDAWELGLKTDLFDRQLRINTALFYQDLEDFQVLEFTGVQFVTFNVDKAESKGAEVEFEANPLDQLNMSLAVTYQDASYPSDCVSPGASAQAASLCGADLTNAPEWVGVLDATWEDVIPGTEFRYFANASVRGEDERRTSTQPQDPTTGAPAVRDFEDANAKVNLRFGISTSDGRWGFEIWGNNIFDKQTKNVTFNNPLRGVGALGNAARGVYIEAPRTYGATFRARL